MVASAPATVAMPPKMKRLSPYTACAECARGEMMPSTGSAAVVLVW